LVTQALNCLPVGQIDGGRITQMGFGRRALGATSLGVYLGLSLGVIGSSLSLSWALYVLICQRTPEVGALYSC
jgi:membrane-associated protease RseP (regulator of RpoE activity)